MFGSRVLSRNEQFINLLVIIFCFTTIFLLHNYFFASQQFFLYSAEIVIKKCQNSVIAFQKSIIVFRNSVTIIFQNGAIVFQNSVITFVYLLSPVRQCSVTFGLGQLQAVLRTPPDREDGVTPAVAAPLCRRRRRRRRRRVVHPVHRHNEVVLVDDLGDGAGTDDGAHCRVEQLQPPAELRVVLRNRQLRLEQHASLNTTLNTRLRSINHAQHTAHRLCSVSVQTTYNICQIPQNVVWHRSVVGH